MSSFILSAVLSSFDILTWKDVEKVHLGYCIFIAATRPGYPVEELNQKLLQIKQMYGQEVYPMEVTGLDIFSTDIRRRVKEGLSIKISTSRECGDIHTEKWSLSVKMMLEELMQKLKTNMDEKRFYIHWVL